MMIGEAATTPKPTIQIPTWDPYDDPMDMLSSSFPALSPSVNINGNASGIDSFMALHRFLPSKEFISTKDSDPLSDDSDLPVDAFSCDYFRMYEFKVRRCARGRSHDWTECPYVHPGEKARRRDPRKYHYSGTACPDYRKSGCSKGDLCELAHGVFESWLHPARYRTQPCKDGPDCCRRVCFFAHTPEELRVLPHQSPRRKESGTADSPIRRRLDLGSYVGDSFVSSPTSILTSPPAVSPSDSPPTSPSCEGSFNSVGELVSSMRGLYIEKLKMGGGGGGSTRGLQMGSGFCSPRCSILKPGFSSLPSTPTGTAHGRSGLGQLDMWESSCKEEPTMERVESGRALRGKMYAKLSKENPLNRVNSATSATDIGWVYELVN